MDSTANRIKYAMQLRGLNQSDIISITGINKGALSSYLSGRYKPKQTNIYLLSKALNVSEAWLMGADVPMERNSDTKLRGVKINILGRVAAGLPLEAIENIIDTEEISEELACTGEFFGLQIRGDSMEPRIYNGDVVIVRRQEDAESGDTVIALVNGNDAVCKRLAKYSDGIGLISLNSAKYEPMIFSSAEIQSKPVKIIGKVVELRGKL